VESHEQLPPPVGGGGTDFRPFFESARRESAATAAESEPLLVYITDGHGTFPSTAPGRPVLWVVVPGGIPSTNFPFGEVVRMV
jgi:predicted metal-dependent peptidase